MLRIEVRQWANRYEVIVEGKALSHLFETKERAFAFRTGLLISDLIRSGRGIGESFEIVNNQIAKETN